MTSIENLRQMNNVKDLEPEEFDTPLSSLQREIIHALNDGPMRRRRLVKKLERPRSTIYDNLVILKRSGIVEKYSKKTNHERGAPYVFWRLVE